MSDEIEGHIHPVAAIGFSADGALMATGALTAVGDKEPNEVRVWRLDDSQPKIDKVLTGCIGWIKGVAISHDGQLLAAADDSGIRCWDLETAAVVATLTHRVKPYGDDYDSPGSSVEFARDRRILASGWSFPHLRLTDFTRSPPETIDSYEPLNHHNEGMGFSPDGRMLAVASTNLNVVEVLERAPLRLKFRLTLRPTPMDIERIESLAWSPDGRHIAAAARNGEVNVWENRAGADPFVLQGHPTVVSHVSFGRNGKVLASGDWDGNVALWDIASRKPTPTRIWSFSGRIWRLAFAPDGRHLAAADGTGVVYVLRLKDG